MKSSRLGLGSLNITRQLVLPQGPVAVVTVYDWPFWRTRHMPFTLQGPFFGNGSIEQRGPVFPLG